MSATLAHKLNRPAEPSRPEWFEDDPRWNLAQRVVGSRQFVRSVLLSKFLLYIVAETIEGRHPQITEHEIGVRVFDRPRSYRTVEDNIVRNYARQLRRRLAEYFASEGIAEPEHIEIPLGGYVPVFLPAHRSAEETAESGPRVVEVQSMQPPPTVQLSALSRFNPLQLAALFAAWSVAIVALTWFAAFHRYSSPTAAEPTDALWSTLFGDFRTTYVVPTDAGFNLLEDVAHRSLPLADYISGNYQKLPLGSLDDHSATDLRVEHFTSFLDLQVVSTVSRLIQFRPERAIIRFPRDLRISDLKTGNAILLGSEGSNPWAAVMERDEAFRISDQPGMNGAVLVNEHPKPGESATYVSRWNEPAHETFGLIQYLPNLDGTGHVLLLQGLDVAGTQAAADMIFHPAAIAPVLKQAMRPDRSVRPFEILLRSTSVESNALGTTVVASRVY